MLNPVDLKEELQTTPLWRQAFRPFFLFGTLFSVVALLLWASVLEGLLTFTPFGGTAYWHAHEMIFGFVVAVIIGFLLTAVQSWTGLRATNGKPLVGLFGLWLLGRIVIFVNPLNSLWLVTLIDVSFLVVSAFLLGKLVLKVKQYRNLIFVPVLLLLAGANLLTHLAVLKLDNSYFIWGIYSAVTLITLLMTIVTGRVVPMFTANGTGTKKADDLPLLENIVIGLTMFIALIYITNLVSVLSTHFLTWLFSIAAVSHVIRALRWRPLVTLKTPLVWSLHLAYWFIPISLGLFALHYAGFNITASTALHGLTAGAMSNLILAMMARISLGHTGRKLQPHSIIKYAFILVFFAGLTRITLAYLPANFPLNIYTTSALLWSMAFCIYLIFYLKILTSPRPDGRPG